MKLIGRIKEIAELEKLYNSNKAEFVGIYGRRRVGKTFLVHELFKDRITFSHAGIYPYENNIEAIDNLEIQLNHFYNSLKAYGLSDKYEKPKNWLDAFFLLRILLEKKKNDSKQVVFLDELPWLDTPSSGFLRAFEGFWNSWGCFQSDLLLIVCGSATSWIINNLVNNHGGLYNRLTYEIKIMPFTLKECKEFFVANDINFSNYDIVQSYMVFGGIPYYLGLLDGKLDLYKNIDNLFFNQGAKLKNEFDRLFSSAFVNAKKMKEVVEILNQKKVGMTRNEIAEKLKLKSGGNITKLLDDLVNCDFAIKYKPLQDYKKETLYKLIDPLSLFYLKFVKNKNVFDDNFFSNRNKDQLIITWRGYAFENVIFNHIDLIKDKLGIIGVNTTNSVFFKRGDKDDKGAQVDLIINRDDNIINACEIKFLNQLFRVDRDYYLKLLDREEVIYNTISDKRKYIHHVLITTFGLNDGDYSKIFLKTITIDDLFS